MSQLLHAMHGAQTTSVGVPLRKKTRVSVAVEYMQPVSLPLSLSLFLALSLCLSLLLSLSLSRVLEYSTLRFF